MCCDNMYISMIPGPPYGSILHPNMNRVWVKLNKIDFRHNIAFLLICSFHGDKLSFTYFWKGRVPESNLNLFFTQIALFYLLACFVKFLGTFSCNANVLNSKTECISTPSSITGFFWSEYNWPRSIPLPLS